MTDLLGGGSGVNAPNFENVDLSPGMESQGSEIAGAFGSRGIADSTNETQAQAGNVLGWSTKQEEMNNQNAQLAFQDQLQAYQANSSSLQGAAFGAGFGL